MTATLSDTCSTFTITSDFLVSGNTSNSLVVVHNTTTTTITIATTTVGTYILLPATLGMTDTFDDGVYSFTLTTVSSTSIKTTESLCRASLCGIKCTMIDNYLDVADFAKAMAYEGLKLANDCVKCDCTLLNTLYTVLTNVPIDDCNCGQTSV